MRIGTRGSALALAQADFVSRLLGGCEIVTIATAGDQESAGGDKSRWVNELERALSAGEIDLAVHSAKDVPGELADGLALLGAPARAPAEDVLCVAGRSPLAPDDSSAARTGLEQLPPERAWAPAACAAPHSCEPRALTWGW